MKGAVLEHFCASLKPADQSVSVIDKDSSERRHIYIYNPFIKEVACPCLCLHLNLEFQNVKNFMIQSSLFNHT